MFIPAHELYKLASPRNGQVDAVPFEFTLNVDKAQPKDHLEIKVLSEKALGKIGGVVSSITMVRRNLLLKGCASTFKRLHSCLVAKVRESGGLDGWLVLRDAGFTHTEYDWMPEGNFKMGTELSPEEVLAYKQNQRR